MIYLTLCSGDGVDGNVQLLPGGAETQPISTFEVDFTSLRCRPYIESLKCDLDEVLSPLGKVSTTEDAISLLNTVKEEYNPEGKRENPDLEKDVYPVVKEKIRTKLMGGDTS